MKIFLDSGHNASGYDTGAQGNGLKEQDITYQLAQKIGDRLKNNGIDVKYSRGTIASNVGTTLNERINGRVIWLIRGVLIISYPYIAMLQQTVLQMVRKRLYMETVQKY